MGWETLIIGNFEFKNNIEETIKQKIIEDLKCVLECDVDYNEEWNEYHFEFVNWNSHISGENIEKVVKKYKKYLKYFCISIYYLDEPHEEITLDNNRVVSCLI